MSREDEVNRFVDRKINILLTQAQTGGGKQALASLRKGIGKKPGELPELWGVFLQDLPEAFLSQSGKPSREEEACYLSITMFALHQQGHDEKKEPMHRQGYGLGTSLRELARQDGDDSAEDRILRRLRELTSSKNMEEFSYHLRQIVQLLRGKGIPLDYGKLAGDIYRRQFSDSAYQTYLKWGQEFFTVKKTESEED